MLGEADAELFARRLRRDAEAGNWEGHTILNRLRNPLLGSPTEEKALAHMRVELLARRAGRVRPGWDDKVLADWNGLMIAALAHAARVFERPDWLDAAATAFGFVVQHMEKDGRLAHSWRAGQAKAPATASDYANMIWARAAAAAGHQRGAPSSRRRSAGAPRWTSISGWRTAAAMPSPPTIRPTSSCACAAPTTTPRPTPTPS